MASQLGVAFQQARLRDEVARRASALEELVSELRRSHDQRRVLLAHLVSAQEEERANIAADVHDDPIQKLTAVDMRLELLRRSLTDPEQLAVLKVLRDAVELSIGSLRQLVFELRPPALDREGISTALREYLHRIVPEASFEFRIEDHLVEQPPADTRALVYRIAQEALVNVRKHAQARQVDVLLESRDAGILVRIRDDGLGFRPELTERPVPGHLGLPSMRERAETAGGRFAIESSPGHGTVVEFWLPLTP